MLGVAILAVVLALFLLFSGISGRVSHWLTWLMISFVIPGQKTDVRTRKGLSPALVGLGV